MNELVANTSSANSSPEEDIVLFAQLAEQACARMYDSSYPKDDRDDALAYLSKAIQLAGCMGNGREEARLKQRYAEIEAVFNSQFRWAR
jgi:hypothetical protein